MDLYLQDLTPEMPGITTELRAVFAQAAAVCLNGQGHTSGVDFAVRGFQSGLHRAFWDAVSETAQASWDDPTEATESGAVGVAVTLAVRVLGKKIVKRARIGTGFDYWLGESEDDSINMFENTARLEVSGIRRNSDQAVDARVEQKLKQTTRSNNDFPAVVIVVEFSKPQAKIATR